MKITRIFLAMMLVLCLLLSSCFPAVLPDDENTGINQGNGSDENNTNQGDNNPDSDIKCEGHADADDDDLCDLCGISIYFTFNIFAFNDLHGVFKDTESSVGVAGLTSYINKAKNENTILLSAGDSWQGTSESNLTSGKIMTEWMNFLGIHAMTLGNHEFDWGEDAIEENAALANFPLLAINIYDKDTNERVSYAQPSVLVDLGEYQVGIIGAIGNCYSSISGEVNDGFYFKTGDALTALVKDESDRLRKDGADFIIYSLHDGHDVNSTSSGYISDADLSAYYDIELSDGYVDLVYEGHTHKKYVLKDTQGVYHIQTGGYNQAFSRVDVSVNLITGKAKATANSLTNSVYSNMAPDAVVDDLLEKYKNDISKADEVLGILPSKMYSSSICDLVADLYLEAGLERWGDKYDIVLGGGFLKARSPYNLEKGEVKYRDLQAIMPFDNEIVLCAVSGAKLLDNFINTSNSDYHITLSAYGSSIKNSISRNKTYYIVVDTYTSTYAYNGLTEIERYGTDVYARDLLAEYIKKKYN